MVRPRDPERFSQLVSTAISVFIRRGYRRAQMADIAEAMGVAKGTLYLYVESKEALFDLAVRGATDHLEEPVELPVPTPKPGSTLRYVEWLLSRDSQVSALEKALQREAPRDIRAEFSGIARELYRLMQSRRMALKLLDRNATDYPDLAAAYFSTVRERVPRQLERYLASRVPERPPEAPPLAALARGVLEVIAFWAIHRHWDPFPTPVDEKASEATAIRLALGALGT